MSEMSEKYEYEVKVEEFYKYIGHQPDARSIGGYKTKKEAIRAGLEFQMNHQNYGFRVVYNGQAVVCQPAPSS